MSDGRMSLRGRFMSGRMAAALSEPIEVTISEEFYLGGVRFEAGHYSIRRITAFTPWQCDHCGHKLASSHAPCPVHGDPPSHGWCPF